MLRTLLAPLGDRTNTAVNTFLAGGNGFLIAQLEDLEVIVLAVIAHGFLVVRQWVAQQIDGMMSK